MKALLAAPPPTASGSVPAVTIKRRFVQPYVPLRTQTADLCVLERYISEMLDVQQFEPELREHLAALKVVERSLEVLHNHTANLAAILDSMPPQKNQLQRPATAMAGMFVGFVSKMRARDLPAMLRDDFTLLNMAAMSYTMLHTAGLALCNVDTAELALRHLRHLVPLVQEITRLMPSVVEQQLAKQCAEVKAGVISGASMNAMAAWHHTVSVA